MNGPRRGEARPRALAQNMSAPPRSTFSFQPYGTAPEGGGRPDARPAGMAWRLRVSPDILLKAHVPPAADALAALRKQALARARSADRAGAADRISELRRLRVRGLLLLAGRLAGEDPGDPEAPMEALLDRLADLAPRLPRPDLPAMGTVEPARRGGPVVRRSTRNPVAGLWLLTHVNGRTFDRDGPAALAADLAEGGGLDLYTC